MPEYKALEIIREIPEAKLRYSGFNANASQLLTPHRHLPSPKNMLDPGSSLRFLAIGCDLLHFTQRRFSRWLHNIRIHPGSIYRNLIQKLDFSQLSRVAK